MSGGYLQRVVESGMTSLRDLRTGQAGAPPRAMEDPPASASMMALDDGTRPTTHDAPTLSRIDPTDSGIDAVPAAPPSHHPPAAAANVLSVRIAASAPTAPAPPAAVSAAAGEERHPRHPEPDSREVRHAHERVPIRAAGRRGAHAPSLRDAGIRSVSPEDGAVTARSSVRLNRPSLDGPQSIERRDARREPARDRGASAEEATAAPRASVDFAVTSAPGGEGPKAPVSAAQRDQWQRLRDRLLLEHYPGAPAHAEPAAGPRGATGNREPFAAGTDVAAGREIVIDQLEVVVAAPPQAASAATPVHATPSRSGAWSTATRRYLGKL